MKTREQLQAALDEIAEVCRKHGVMLEGVANDDMGCIMVLDAEWRGADDGKLRSDGDDFVVFSIGGKRE